MKAGLGRTMICAALALSGLSASAQAPTDADAVPYDTMCTGEDWVVFNATVPETGKIVSVCMAEGDDENPSHLTYRFGTPGNPELSHPPFSDDEGWRQTFTLRRYTRARTTYLKFEFTTDGLNYEILDGGDETETYTGLLITRVSDGDIVTEQGLLPDTDALSLMALEDLVQTAPFDE